MHRTNSTNRPRSALPPKGAKIRPTSANKKPEINVPTGSINSIMLDPFSASNKSTGQHRSPPLVASGITLQSKTKTAFVKRTSKPNTERQPFEEIQLPPGQSSQAFPSLNLSSPSYRFVQPQAQKVDISQKLWMDAVEKSTGLVSNPLTSPSHMRPKSGVSQKNRIARTESREEASGDYQHATGSVTSYGNENMEMGSIGTMKPFSFLSTVGGKHTSLTDIVGEGNANKRPNTAVQQSRIPVKEGGSGDISIFFNSNVDKTEKVPEKKPKPERPQTVAVSSLIQRNESAGALKTTKHVIIRAQKPGATGETKPEDGQKRPFTASEPMLRKAQSANIRISSSKGRLTSANILSGGRKKTAESTIKSGVPGEIEGVEPEELQDEFESLGIKEDLEDDDEVYMKMEAARNLKKNPSRPFSSARPISGVRAGPEEFFANFAKFTNFAEMENVYEELFDRNERTLAATFAKFGDLGYYSPLQRIGCYMQYSSKLKKEHLDEIIDFLKTVTSVEKPEFEVPIQLAIIDELNPFQNRQKTGISTTFQLEDITREPLTLSLYPEYIDLTDVPKDVDNLEPREGTASQIAAQRYFERMLDQMNGNYDPQYLGHDNFLYVPPEQWPKIIKEKVALSYKRYTHYIQSNEIKDEEISKFKKEWITNALSLISEPLLKNYEESVRKMFQEIFENYRISMKEAIVNYILLNPDERKRLNITLLLQHVPCSAERIAREGGFSIKLYPAWHEFVSHGKNEMKTNSYQLSVVPSAVLDWFEDFANLSLFENETIKRASLKGYTLDIPSFKRLENSYRFRTISLMKNIFYRGVILILKRCKQLKRKQPVRGQWTTTGFKTRAQLLSERTDYHAEEPTDPSYVSFTGAGERDGERKPLDNGQFYDDLIYNQLDLECTFREAFDYLDDIQHLEQLLDIRESPAYRVYSVLSDLPLRLEENLYKLSSKEERKSLRLSVGVQVSLLLRRIVEKAVNQFYEFFINIRTLEEMEDELGYLKPTGSRASIDNEAKEAKEQQKPGFPKHIKDTPGGILKNVTGEAPRSKGALGTKNDLTGRNKGTSLMHLEKMDLQKSDFMYYQSNLFPVLRIDMILEEGTTLKFKETEEYIKNEIGTLYRGLVEAFNGFIHPEYTKIEIKNNLQGMNNEKKDETAQGTIANEEREKRRMALGNEEVLFASNAEEIYSKFCEIVYLKEKLPKKKVVAFGLKEEPEPENLVPKHLKVADLNEDFFIDIFEQTVEHIIRHYVECQQSFNVFAQFKPFFSGSISKEIKLLFAKKNFVFEEYKNYLVVLKNFEDLLNQVPNNIYFPMFEVNCASVKQDLGKSIYDLKNKIFTRLEANIGDQFKSISDKYNYFVNYIRRDTDTPDEVELMEKFIYDLNFERSQLKSRANEAFRSLLALFKLEFISNEMISLSAAKEIHEWPGNLDKELKSAEEKHSVQRKRLEDKLLERRLNFEIKVDGYCEVIDQYTNFTEYGGYKNNIEQISGFEKQLNEAEEEMLEIQDHEKKLFGIVSQYDKFITLKKTLEPYVEFWNTVGDFLESKKSWMYGPFTQVNPLDVETAVKIHIKTSNKLGKMFDKNPITSRIASEYKDDVQSVSEMLPVIEVLCNPGLKERHWTQIENMIQAKFNPEEGTLKDILNKGVNNHLTQIEELSEQASKEFKLETMLNKMEKEWEDLKFVVTSWKNSNVLILQGAALEDIMLVLDDHTLKAQTIRSNPNVKFMEERAVHWEKLMLYIQEVLDVWIKVQSSYLYLEPIFGSEDIIGQMPKEAKKFSEVDTIWKDIMVYVDRDPLVLHVEKIPRLLERLNSSLLQIEEIQRGLNDYLEHKRLDFPRFFFLSNEDLLNILAETKDPLLVQPHLKKCFEGINELIFSSNVEIIGMRSSEGEEISFLEKISPKNYKSNVEQWLGKVEEQMRASLQKVTEDSLNDLTKTRIPRAEWVVKWPGQVVICISQTIWTFTVEERLKTSGLNGIKDYNDELRGQLEDIVALVRGNLTNQERITLGALIVIEVHARDVVSDLVQDKVTETEAFEWISQMRYYWEAGEKRINVRMITSALDYGYEYLGNTGRLVITPLTDRCYRTLMSALQLNLGGAPEGPAGTGKTETTKDLAKALAMQCVVFNCSEGLNSHAMAKFFKGLASAGAWSCFDEFNRIELEVLSVVAQQILEIQQAKNLGKRHFAFAGTQSLELKPTCNVFITMNPGYAGRSELPDNLKALFRPVAMMVPDYAMIAEISLYSYGFDQARDLARKIVATYKLCSEQLSSQDHYDYGMRAVKAVLTTAGQLKRKFLLEKEDTLMLRSICDVNLPKFLTQDIQLFMGIISDLFPSVKPPQVDYGVLNDTVNNSIQKFNLQNVPNFRKKIFQLYEMVNCRHGLMLVGQPFSGKTMCYRVLAKALGEAASTGESEELPASYHVINPKSLTIAQLYGYSDPISKEWTEGVLAEIFRKCATSTAQERQWIVFDGPVDADWIENMNTVLDDNKKLCLMNGETIAMSNFMTMMFEVADLLQASPATVSRCGMIYMQPDNIGWWPLVVSWATQFEQIFESQIFKHLEDLFDGLLGKCIEFIKSKCFEYQAIPEGNLAFSAMRIMQALMTEHNMVSLEGVERMKPEELIAKLDQLFLYSIIWTVAATTNEAGRKLFSTFLKKVISDTIKCDNHKDRLLKVDKSAVLPEGSGSNVQDYYLEEFKWKNWRDRLDKLEVVISPEMRYHDIVVPTTESLRITSFLKLAIAYKFPFLLIGPTGTGKSLFIGNHLKSLSLETNTIIFVTFSAQTTATQTQEIIDEKMDKIRKGIYGPGFGKKCLIFIDDLNMPAYDKYGAQPPIELIRQFFDHRGWYDKKDRKFREIVETNILAAMGPPGGGRNVITPRLIRHFYVYATTEFDDKTFVRIFNKIIDWHLAKQGLDTEVGKTLRFAVEGSIEVYMQVCENLKPTPAKSHYLFNLRDLSRVVQGMLLLGKNQANDSKKLVRLWMHEVCRVFYDRLTVDADQVWFFNLLAHTTKNKLRETDMKVLFKPLIKDDLKLNMLINSHEILKYLRFGDIMSDELDPRNRPYDEITDQPALQKRIERYLEEYNETTKKPMNLVMFEFAVDHVLRICRLLRMSRSHALLVGLGGSGRQSLTRIAAYICEHEVFTVEVSKSYTFDQWRSDIKRLLISAGVDLKYYVFLITDKHIVGKFVLEDLNNLLNSGDVPNAVPQEDFLPLIDKLRAQARQEGKEDLYNYGTNTQFYDYFVENVKAHLHIVLVQSSIGDALRTRMRMFPSIVNCCTCIWYKRWPDEALHAVAHKFILDLGVDLHVQRGMINSVKFMHESVKQLSEEYLRVEGRYNYITPTSYLELLSSLKNLLETQRKKLGSRLESYEKGVEKLLETAEEVKRMEKELKDKRPVLIQMKEENSKLSATIEKNIQEMEPKRLQVEQEEAYVNSRVEEAEVIRNDCQQELDKALPLVDKAKKALQNIDPNDIINLKSMLKPPVTVQLVMEAVCVLLKEGPIKIPNPENPKDKIDSYWEKSKKLLSDKTFLQRLLAYDIDHIDEATMERVRANYLSRTADFNPQRVEKASGAAKGLCEWVIALHKYEKVLAIVRPKQKEYDRACEEVETLRKSLKQKTDELNVLNIKLKDLQDKYAETREKQAILEDDINMCQKKLDRAQILTGSLGGERDRWSEAVTEYQNKVKYVVGDVLLSAGTISYLAPFSSVYRGKIQKEWMDMVRKNDIQVSDNYSLEQSLGEPILIRKWVINGLPSDSFSKENGIIMANAGRYSLMIDPQNQANKWIKNNEMDNELRVVKQTDSDFVKTLENAVTFGWVLLIENVHEELDAILEPILMKQTFKTGGVLSIRIGESIVDFNKSFRLFMTTKLRNPHYPPEVSIKITLVNFMITKEGLDDQLLEIAVAKENPDLEEMRSKLIVQSHENQRQLEEIENKILGILRTSQGNILNDEEAINVLAQSKLISKDIEEKQKSAEVTEKKIEEARTGYKPIALHSRVLFFALMSLSNIEVVYQYSLTWFIQLFLNAFNQAEKSTFLLQRVNNVIETLTYSIYTNVCRSLFEKDKLIFSFVLTHAILESKGKINPKEYTFFISPPASNLNAAIPQNPISWIPAATWARFYELSKVTDYFRDILQSLIQEESQWQQIYEDQEAHKKTFPAPFQACSHMQRLCILKVLRPDRVISAIREFITGEMSIKFITPPTFDLNKSFSESVATQPLIFILPGTDPMSLVINFAEQQGKAHTLQKISLGQGQGPIAERAIKEARESAGWVILQNCHLAPSWMPELEKICEALESKAGKEKTHPSFRLWLTTYPSTDFPVSILQSSVKMTNEPPKGLKNNMMVSYMSDPINQTADFYETNSKPKEFKKLLFGLCMFHAVLQERRNYGALGWNIHYDFNQSDLRISVKQLHLFLDQYKGVPFKALHYLTGECNYGGRVTDDRDRRILRALVEDFYSEKILQEKYAFAGLSAFSIPDASSYDNVLKYLESMPPVAPPELFGFHSNAEISKDLKETNEMCYNLLLIGGGSQAGAKDGESDEVKLKKVCEDILAKIPKEFNPEIVKAKYPVSYANSMNTVLNQEIIRYNKLSSTIISSLKNIDQALKGLQVMSEQLEKVTQSLLRGLVPDMWKKKSYPSLKPLGSYIYDLIQRLAYFQKWIDSGYPNVYWISGFFFTQSFLTGVLQNYARKHTIPIDNLTFDFAFLDEPPANPDLLQELYQVPEEGCFIHGLFLEGCRWDYEHKRLDESHLKVLYSLAPIIWLKPIEQSEVRDYPFYRCPVYKTTERKGTLSTTGHSTNFIMTVNMDSDREESHWIKRGVAMICQLSD